MPTVQMRSPLLPAAALAAAALGTRSASAASSGGRVGGRVRSGGGGGSYRGGGGGTYRPAPTNVYISPPPIVSPFGFSPFGFSPFGFAPFGFGFRLPFELSVFFLLGLAFTTFRSIRGTDPDDKPGAALCLQVACYCSDRTDSLYGRLQSVARTADTQSYQGLQRLVSDTCLAMLRSSKDWLAGRTTSYTAGILTNDVDTSYNRLVVQERSKWENEQQTLRRTSVGKPTYMVATLVILLREGKELPQISTVASLREVRCMIALFALLWPSILHQGSIPFR